MQAPDFKPLLMLAVVGMILLAPVLLPWYAVVRVLEWFEDRRSLRKIDDYAKTRFDGH